jgi:hypothetical protein
MRLLSATELLSAWEQGQGQPAVTQALLLLGLVRPIEAVARLSIGRRDALLLTMREQLFGPRLTSTAVCPRCSQRLELAFEVADIRAAADDVQPETLKVESGGYEARFRLPDSGDLAAVADSKGGRRGARATGDVSEILLARCLLQVRRKGRRQPQASADSLSDLPGPLIAAIAEKMGEADPQANVRLDLTCAYCGHRWSALFDIVSYLWSEIDDWARRILREVHTLASAYGWREADILTMSARRRQMYMQMLGV